MSDGRRHSRPVTNGLSGLSPPFVGRLKDLRPKLDHLRLAADAREALTAAWPEVTIWDDLNLFFGGVHAVRAAPRSGDVSGAGDPRRGGVALIG